MEHLLIAFDERLHVEKKQAFELYSIIIQSVVDNYNVLKLPALKSSEMLQLFTDTASLIFDKMTGGEPLSIAGLQVDKVKAIEILVKPEGYEAFIQSVADIKQRLASAYNNNAPFNILAVEQAFELIEGQVTLKASKAAELEYSCKVFAKTERAIKMFQFATSIQDKAEELGLTSLLEANPDSVGKVINNLFNKDGRSLTIRTAGILIYNDPNRSQP